MNNAQRLGMTIRGHFLGASGLIVLLAGLASAQAQTAGTAATAASPDIGGIYWTAAYSAMIQPVGGGSPPYTPAAMATYQKNIAAAKAGTLEDNARKFCVPDGVPRVLQSPYPFEIVQTPVRGEIHIFNELNHGVRLIQMDKPMPSENELLELPYYNGHSVGHWDGETLVVETAGFNDKTFLDNSGAPHTDKLRTVERIRRINGGKELEDIVTIHDTGVFTKDWSARFVYEKRSDIRMMEYNCGEKHRVLSPVKGVRVP
jgi:hypothetical protein